MRALIGILGGCFLAAALPSYGQSAPAAPTKAQTQADVIARALDANPEILAARQQVMEAQSHVAEIAGHRRFQLNLDGSASYSNGEVAQGGPIESFGTVTAALNAPLPNLRRAGAEADQAIAGLAAARSRLTRAVLDVEFRTSQAFFELLRDRDAASIAQENLNQAQRQADDTQARIRAGDVPPADLLKAQVPVAQARAALARARNAARASQQNLNDLLQRDLNTPEEVVWPVRPATEGPPVDRAVAEAMRRSPDVIEADANLSSAKANERVQRRLRDPDFSVQLSHTRSGDPTAYSYLSALTLSVSLPLADGGSARELYRQAQLQTDQAQTAFKLAQQRVRLAVEQALLDVEGDQANVDADQQTEEIARQSLEKARQSYQAGLTTTRDVLDAQLVYSQSRIDTNSARYDLEIAQAHVKQLLGGTSK